MYNPHVIQQKFIALVVIFVFAVGCSSSEPVTDETPSETPAVDEDKLDEEPCESSRWEESPPGVTSLGDDEDD